MRLPPWTALLQTKPSPLPLFCLYKLRAPTHNRWLLFAEGTRVDAFLQQLMEPCVQLDCCISSHSLLMHFCAHAV